MASTQDHISIDDIKDGVVVLKDGGAAVVIRTSAVNFGLLSADEQIAIIGSFAQMLNSLSFPIQITILSKKLDISAYLKLLEKAQALQTNALLSQMMLRYRRFIQSLIKDNEVLDKQFYISVPLSSLELGVGWRNKEEKFTKAKTLLGPKRDQIMRQLNRIGLNADALNDKELVELFYEIYNPPDLGPVKKAEGEKTEADKKEGGNVSLNTSTEKPVAEDKDLGQAPVVPTINTAMPAASSNPEPAGSEPAPIPAALAPKSLQTLANQPRSNQPFVVEELPDIS